MISVSYKPSEKNFSANLAFHSKSETFWKAYRHTLGEIPLKSTLLESITNQDNFLGEGLSKKGYNIAGIKDYVVRVYKNFFRLEDLEQSFVKPKRNHLNTLEGVVLCIPNKIDIVKKRKGISIGVDNYAERIQVTDFPPLRAVSVSREETLKSLELYEQLKDFPLKSFKQAYLQVKKFCQKPNFQFDIISPNNILIDTATKKITLIDPVSPKVNTPVHGKFVDFSEYHGVDSLYHVMCDFLMHKEHLKNLTPQEITRWEKSINTIIAKSVSAGENLGFKRNIDEMRDLYGRITKFWQTDELENRYNSFLEMYSGVINPTKTAQNALNYQNGTKERIHAISQLNAPEFKTVKPIFEKILEAPHQPKVEFPEIINSTLDKISEYGKSAKSITPTLEQLFNKEIFSTTKKRLFNLFIEIQPQNKRFLEEIRKSSLNPIEKTMFKDEFETLYKKSESFTPRYKQLVNSIYENSTREENLPQELTQKLWISRTCTNTNPAQKIAINNMLKAYKQIELNTTERPNISHLVELHKTLLTDIPREHEIAGKLRTPDTDELVRKIFHITKDPKTVVNDYSASKDVVEDLNKLEKFIEKNYDKMPTFEFATEIFAELIRIHPFINGNGRVARLFTEQFLQNKGFRLTKWPEEFLYRKLHSTTELAKILEKNSIPY